MLGAGKDLILRVALSVSVENLLPLFFSCSEAACNEDAEVSGSFPVFHRIDLFSFLPIDLVKGVYILIVTRALRTWYYLSRRASHVTRAKKVKILVNMRLSSVPCDNPIYIMASIQDSIYMYRDNRDRSVMCSVISIAFCVPL